MPASSKVRAAYCSYAVSMANFSPRSFISRRWWVRIRPAVLGAGVAAGPAPYGAVSSALLDMGAPRRRLAAPRAESTDSDQASPVVRGPACVPRHARGSQECVLRRLERGPRQLVEQPAEGDLVRGRAGVRGGEPGGVLADLVEPPLEVEEVEHRRTQVEPGRVD